MDMAVEIAQKLTAAGHLDYIECVVGTNLVRESHHRDRWPTGATHGEFRSLARAVKEAVDIPVGYIGGVTGLDHAEDIIASGDLVTAYTSINGRAWTPGATYNLQGFSPPAPLQIGILATAAGAAAPIPAHFSYVHVYQLSGATEPAAGQ
jgi:hypothetical protein